MREPVIAVRYCGSCNPFYDPNEVRDELEKRLGVKFARWNSEELPDICIVLKQCNSDCFTGKEKYAHHGVVFFQRGSEIDAVAALLQSKIDEFKSQF